LQSRKATVIDAETHAGDVKGKLMALKSENGKTLGKFLASFESDKNYHNVEIVKRKETKNNFEQDAASFIKRCTTISSSDLHAKISCRQLVA